MIEPGQEYFCIKSGNRVRAVAPADGGSWTVECVDGESKGKQMLAPSRGLFPFTEELSRLMVEYFIEELNSRLPATWSKDQRDKEIARFLRDMAARLEVKAKRCKAGNPDVL